jgi:hypothetical protein
MPEGQDNGEVEQFDQRWLDTFRLLSRGIPFIPAAVRSTD